MENYEFTGKGRYYETIFFVSYASVDEVQVFSDVENRKMKVSIYGLIQN